MPINLDFSDVKPPEPLPEGNVLLKIVDVRVKPGKKDPEYQVIHLRYELVEPAEFAGRKIRDWISLHPDAIWSAKTWVAALLRCDEEEVTDFDLNEEAIVGEIVGATLVEGEEYRKRKPMNVATYFNPAEYDI
jgi:hypothetical protein